MNIDIYNGFFKGKKVLVTGHTGFKGSWLCIWLHELGAEVVGDGGDVLAGALGDIARGGALQAEFAEQFGRRGEQLPARLLAARPAGGLMRYGSWHGSRSKLINHMINFMPDCLKRNR